MYVHTAIEIVIYYRILWITVYIARHLEEMWIYCCTCMQALQLVCTIYQFPVTSLLAQGRLLQFHICLWYSHTILYLSHAVYATGASGIHVVTLLYLYYVWNDWNCQYRLLMQLQDKHMSVIVLSLQSMQTPMRVRTRNFFKSHEYPCSGWLESFTQLHARK